MNATRQDVLTVSENLKKFISKSFLKNKKFIKNNRHKIYFISGGFREMLLPTLREFGIDEGHIYGNDFLYNSKDEIVGCNHKNPLSFENGKSKILEMLSLEGEIHAIGDGYNDYLLKQSGKASRFFAFTENVYREKICFIADGVLTSFDEYIKIFSY